MSNLTNRPKTPKFFIWRFLFEKVSCPEMPGRCLECDAGSHKNHKHLWKCYDKGLYCPCTYEQQLKLKSPFKLAMQIIYIIGGIILIHMLWKLI